MANNFCRFLSNGYRFKSDGTNLTYQPCCWFTKEISLIDNPNFDQQKEEISKINQWVPECSSCKQIEDSGAYGNRSPRLRSFEEIPDDSIPNNLPGWIELTIDTTCNAACIMCGPWHSTTWRKQEVKFKLKTLDDLPTLTNPTEWLKIIQDKFSFEHVKSVSFLGGEPFESPVPLQVLQTLKRLHGTLSEVVVHFQTNGSIKPSDELMALASECKRVKFNLSIDGVGPRFEYVRYPLKWERINIVVEHVKSLRLKNLKFVSLATLNFLNAFYYDELEQWIKTTFNDEDLITLKPNKSVGKISLAQTPRILRLGILEKFGPEHPVYKLLSNLPIVDIKPGLTYLEWLDGCRNTSWKETFPEIAKMLKYV